MRQSYLTSHGALTEDLLAAEPAPIPLPPSRAPARPILELGSAVRGSAAWREAVGAAPAEPPLLEPDALVVLDELPEGDEPLELTPRPTPAPPLVSVVASVRTPPPRGLAPRTPTPRPREVGAPNVVGVGPADPPPAGTHPHAPRATFAHRHIQERNPTADLPQMVAPVASSRPAPPPGPVLSVRHTQRAEALFEEALKAMVAGDYLAADRHLTLALSFSPSDVRYQVARNKVRRVLGR
jgi:hypothetical protein